MVDLDASSNAALVWSDFADADHLARPLAWARSLNDREGQARKILAPAEGVVGRLAFEYSWDGPKAGKPTFNRWGVDLPSGIVSSGTAAKWKHRADYQMAYQLFGRDVIGSELFLGSKDTQSEAVDSIPYGGIESPGFEHGLDPGWGALGGGTIVGRTTDQAYEGEYSLEVISDGATATTPWIQLPELTLAASVQHWVEVMIYLPEGLPDPTDSLQLRIESGFTGATEITSPLAAPHDKTSRWRSLYLGIETTPGNTTGRLSIWGGGVGNTYYLDGVTVARSEHGVNLFEDREAVLLGQGFPVTSLQIQARSRVVWRNWSDTALSGETAAVVGESEIQTSAEGGAPIEQRIPGDLVPAPDFLGREPQFEGVLVNVRGFGGLAGGDVVSAAIYPVDSLEEKVQGQVNDGGALYLEKDATDADDQREYRYAYVDLRRHPNASVEARGPTYFRSLVEGVEHAIRLNAESGSSPNAPMYWRRVRTYDPDLSEDLDVNGDYFMLESMVLSTEIDYANPAYADDGEAVEIADFEVDLDPAGLPYLALGAEEDIYALDATLRNEATAQEMTISARVAVGAAVRVDVKARTVTDLDSAEPVGSLLSGTEANDPGRWIDVIPGPNPLVLSEPGLVKASLQADAPHRFH